MRSLCLVGLQNLPVLAPEYAHHQFGGAEVQQTLLAKALTLRGLGVSMVVRDYGQEDGACWNDIATFKAYKPEAGLACVRFIHPRWTGVWNALKRANADVYYTSCAGMLVGLLAMFCRLNKRGLVFRLAHDCDADPQRLVVRHQHGKMLYAYGLKHANVVLAQHEGQRRALLANYGVHGHVASPLLGPSGPELPIEKRDIPILWISNVRDFKRPDLAIELAKALPDYIFHMAGGHQDGFIDMYESVRKHAESLPNMVFHGPVPYQAVGDLYARARVFVNTSDVEGFPNSFLQSWQRGVPVVSFFDPGGLIKREGLGIAVSNGDEMQRAVERLVTDQVLWHQYSTRCLSYVERTHGGESVLGPYLDAIEQAYETRGQKAQVERT